MTDEMKAKRDFNSFLLYFLCILHILYPDFSHAF